MNRLNPILAILVLAALPAGCCKRQACAGAAPEVAVSRLAADPAPFVGRTLTVRGVLSNAGGNYFTDLRVVVTDSSGAAVAVQPWLPVEAPPPRPGMGGNRPAVLSDYLGKTVKITACLRTDGGAYWLEVQQAHIISEGNK